MFVCVCVSLLPYRSKPEAYLVKFSLWQKMSRIDTTDIAYVKKLHVHWDYEAQSYQNDIALVELKPLGGTTQCVRSNPAIRSVCVPWSVQQFQPRHDCTISGWGRDKGHSSPYRVHSFCTSWTYVLMHMYCFDL